MSRSNWKSPYVQKNSQKNIGNHNLKVLRSSKILPNFIGLTYLVHNGRSFKELLVTKDMVGYKFGEFFNTRVVHILKTKKQKAKKVKWDKK